MAKDRLPHPFAFGPNALHPGKYGQPPRGRPALVRSVALLMQNPFPFLADFAPTSLLLHHALQGMLVLACKIHHLRHFGLGDFVGEHPTLPDSMVMDVEHYLRRGLDILLEELLKDV